MSTLNDGQSEEFLAILKNFRIAIDVTVITSPSVRINYLGTMSRWQALKEIGEFVSQNNGSTNEHLKNIAEDLLGYFFPINALSEKKRAMRRVMCKPQIMAFRSFHARLTEMKIFLPLFTVLDTFNNITVKELNDILLRTVTSAWENQSYIQWW